MIIDSIYTFLCSLYGIEPQNMPSLFLLDETIKTDIKISSRFSREAVFAIGDKSDTWQVGLFIDPSIIKNLESRHFSADDLSCAIEGISHFIYLINKIEHKNNVSMLELELQAEIDKFIYLSAMGSFQPMHAKRSFDCLFKLFCFNKDLNENEIQIYEKANYFAKIYCLDLLNKIINSHYEIIKKHIIKFYNKTLPQKLNEISNIQHL